MANKQSQFSAIDTKAEMCPGSHGMERKDTSAQKQEIRECLQGKLSLRQGKGLQQGTLPFRELKYAVWQEHRFQGGAMGERSLEK